MPSYYDSTPEYVPNPPSNEAASIIELAECVKELCRVIINTDSTPRYAIKARLEKVYQKASKAKDRMELK